MLVEPSHPGNIGGCARALKNMGLSQLYLVNPQRFPNPQAEWRAANAVDTLDAAVVVDDLDAAIGDCTLVIGTSTRNRRIPWPVLSAAQVAAELVEHRVAEEGQVAILFGRETSGLSNDELQRCNKHLVIPANPEYSSLNLAMAVQVVTYELYSQTQRLSEGERGETQDWDRRFATNAERESFLTHLDEVLCDIDFYDPSSRGQAFTRLRRLFGRVPMDETEVQMLRGILTQMQHKLRD